MSKMIDNKIGILDPAGLNPNPLTGKPYSDNYKSLAKIWSTFPAYTKATSILESIANFQLVFIVSGTGSGKTVLIPKYVLHHFDYGGKIAITLPKRVVTLSAAIFSAKTLDIDLGTDVGYIFKGSDKNMANNTNKLIYMTDGTLIMKFVADPYLYEYNAVIIDEAHERKVQIDLLLLFLKNLLESGKRPDFRVIIMSATIDSNKYQNYFNGINSKIINISGQPNHAIDTYFLQTPTKSYMDEGLKLIDNLVAEYPTKDMLFFITTSNEALRLCRSIRPKFPKVYCIEVYADMDQTLKIFAESRDKYLELGNYEQKLIMATNVAESSLTIDGLSFVIDSGYELHSSFDPFYYGGKLERKLISKAQALQRKGRVGRTEPGVCYSLLTEDQFNSLEPYPVPDILRQDITMDLLKIIQISPEKTFSSGLGMLNQLMDPPTEPFINIAHKLYTMYNIVDEAGHITDIGYKLGQFSSLEINRTLFLIYSYKLHCAKEASIILAMADALGGKLGNLFYKADSICDSDCAKVVSKKLIEKLTQKKGDHLTFLKIYQEFKASTDQKKWAKKYGIRLDVLNKANKEVGRYYYKILGLSRPQTNIMSDNNSGKISGGATNKMSSSEINNRLVEALKQSHRHLTAKKSVPVFPVKKADGNINKDSALYYHYNRKELSNKNFIYDELTNDNGNWVYNLVTII